MSIFSWFGQGKAAAEIKGSEPALTPEGAAHGFSWDRSEDANFFADLWHEGEFMAGVFDRFDTGSALVNVFGEGPALGGKDLGGTYPTLEEGMKAAEEHTLHAMGAIDVQPLADASESYYAKLGTLAESRGGDMDRDASGFDLDR